MVTFSDIATCHIFGILLRISVTCDTPYLTTYCISCTLEILGLEENKAYKFTSSYLIPSLEMPKIIQKHLPKILKQAGNFPQNYMYNYCIQSTLNFHLTSDSPAFLTPRGRWTVLWLRETSPTICREACKLFLGDQVGHREVRPLILPRLGIFLDFCLCCHGGRDFYTCLLEGNMESTSLDGCNWVLLGNDLDLFKTIQKKHG